MGVGVTEFAPYVASATGESYIVSLILPDTAESIAVGTSSAYTFKNFTNLKSVSGKAKEIGEYAFPYCALETVSLPEAQSIGDYVFYGCTHLTEVSLPKVETIGNFAFAGCVLGTVNFPEAQSIGDSAFFICTSTEVSLPKAQSIGDSAFGYTGTEDLTITLGAAVPTLGTVLFSGVGSKPVTVKVPSNTNWSGETGDFTSNENTSGTYWGEGFRGLGWSNNNYTSTNHSSDLNTSVTVKIEYQ
jgi:hypothetical protein